MIYIIESGEYFKIGFATNVKNRMSTYRTHNPNIQLVHSFEGSMEDEKKLHLALKQYRYKLEWFHKFDNWFSVINNVGLDCGIDFNKVKEIKRITDLNLNTLEFNIAFTLIIQVGMNNSFNRKLENVILEIQHLKELFKTGTTKIKGAIQTLIDNEFIKATGNKNNYIVNSDYIDPYLYIGLGFTEEYKKYNKSSELFANVSIII